MNSENLLTRINLSSVNWRGAPGGVPEITRNDIMAALGSGDLPKKYYYLALLYYTDDQEVRRKVELYAYQEAVNLSAEMRWSKAPRGKPYLLGMAVAAHDARLSPRRCNRCYGEGEIQLLR